MIEIISRSKIETKPFNLNYKSNPDKVKSGIDSGVKTDADVDRNTDDLGKYPVVYIDGVMIESTNVKTLKLFNDSFVPTLTLEFSDPTNKLIDENYPLDNSIISIFKESNNKNLMAIKMDFKITDFTIIKGTRGENVSFQIDASLDVDDLYYNNFESYKGTSFKVLKDLSENIKLGFATNIKDTSDEMVWINPSNYRVEFMQEIIKRSYINEDTFLFGYIDFYYNFNYVDIETQMEDDISEQMNLLGSNNMKKEQSDDSVPLVLSNNPDIEQSNLYITKYTIVNSSTNINLQYGYNHSIFYYDRTDDGLKNYTLDNITTDKDNSIVLKGNPNDKNGLYDNMVCNTYMGKQDNDNVHEKYLDTMLHNRNNLKFLQKLKMVIKLNQVNYALYRFQKVEVELFNMSKTVSSEESQVTPEDKEKGVGQHDHKIINKLSGEWLITAINFTFSKTEGNVQEITLVKRELTDKYTFPRRKKSK